MNSPVAGGVGPESFFSPGQAERGQAGAGRAAAAGVTAGACPSCFPHRFTDCHRNMSRSAKKLVPKNSFHCSNLRRRAEHAAHSL